MDFIFGLVVVSALLMGFIYISSSARVGDTPLASIQRFLRSAKEDRPIIVLIALLGASYFIFSFMEKLFIFFLGIVLPVQGLFFCFDRSIVQLDFFSYYSPCNITKTKFSK